MDCLNYRACRLCFETHFHLIDIFDDALESSIAHIIDEHIGKVITKH